MTRRKPEPRQPIESKHVLTSFIELMYDNPAIEPHEYDGIITLLWDLLVAHECDRGALMDMSTEEFEFDPPKYFVAIQQALNIRLITDNEHTWAHNLPHTGRRPGLQLCLDRMTQYLQRKDS